jgi:hypothetical protein
MKVCALSVILSGTLVMLCGEARFQGKGWRSLIHAGLGAWQTADSKPLEWFTTDAVTARDGDKTLKAVPAAGDIIVNGAGRTSHLVTKEKFGDVELHVEFLIPKGSNSGVYLHGLYEVQILDSYGVKNLSVHDCGAIYERWIDNKGAGGTPPLLNASKPSGEWQSFDIKFQAPRFDAKGRKISNARFVEVIHNGTVIHRDVEAEGPTRASLSLAEAPTNPLMLQGDHGPVAFRNLYIRRLTTIPQPTPTARVVKPFARQEL